MKRFLIILIFSIPLALSAQTFDKAIGIRGGHSSGFEYRIYTNDANSYKFLLATRNNGIQLHAFKEFHEYDLFPFSEQLSLFYGLGAISGTNSGTNIMHKTTPAGTKDEQRYWQVSTPLLV